MNLIDAIKSGKRFKRLNGDVWQTTNTYSFTAADVVSEEWVVEEEQLTFTKTQLWKAWEECTVSENDFQTFCTLLGFK